MKVLKNYTHILTLFFGLLFTVSCGTIDKFPLKYNYHFSIVDSIGNNLVGDSNNTRRYNISELKFYSADGTILRTGFPQTVEMITLGGIYFAGYKFGVRTTTNSNDSFLIKYNSLISNHDVINVVYGKDNINVFQNRVLIYHKENISQTTEIYFNIVK